MISYLLSWTKRSSFQGKKLLLTLLHSERPKLYAILAFLGAIGLKEEFLPTC